MSDIVSQSKPKKFPRWIQLPGDAGSIIVNDCATMSAFLGAEYDEDAELVVKQEPSATALAYTEGGHTFYDLPAALEDPPTAVPVPPDAPPPDAETIAALDAGVPSVEDEEDLTGLFEKPVVEKE